MKKVTLAVLFCVITVINGYSQTKQESIKELFHLMQKDSLMYRSVKSMNPDLLSQIIKDSTSLANFKEMKSSNMQTSLEFSIKLTDEEMALYDKYFSQNEINDFIAFYKSPAGQKLTRIAPEIQKEAGMNMIQKYMPNFPRQ
jgi:hypothetical protein